MTGDDYYWHNAYESDQASATKQWQLLSYCGHDIGVSDFHKSLTLTSVSATSLDSIIFLLYAKVVAFNSERNGNLTECPWSQLHSQTSCICDSVSLLLEGNYCKDADYTVKTINQTLSFKGNKSQHFGDMGLIKLIKSNNFQ